MQTDCLFCEGSAGSKEHLWPAWIHQRKDFGPLKVTIGGSPEEIRNDPAQKIDTVCHKCNNEWMSRVEDKTKPIIACMFEDFNDPARPPAADPAFELGRQNRDGARLS